MHCRRSVCSVVAPTTEDVLDDLVHIVHLRVESCDKWHGLGVGNVRAIARSGKAKIKRRFVERNNSLDEGGDVSNELYF